MSGGIFWVPAPYNELKKVFLKFLNVLIISTMFIRDHRGHIKKKPNDHEMTLRYVLDCYL